MNLTSLLLVTVLVSFTTVNIQASDDQVSCADCALASEIVENKIKDCSADHKELVENALLKARELANTSSLEATISERKTNKIIKKLNSLIIICADEKRPCEKSTQLDGYDASILNRKIHLCVGNMLTGDAEYDLCYLASAIAHEAAHTARVKSARDHNDGPNNDLVYTFDKNLMARCLGSAL